MKINPKEIAPGSFHFHEPEEWDAPDPIVEDENTPEWDRSEDYKVKSSESYKGHKEARLYPELTKVYSLFKDYFHPKDDVVYYPCCGEDMSPSSVFQKSRVIYVDFEDKAIEHTGGLEFHNTSAMEFDPGEVDILILLNPQISPVIPCSYVAEGGYVLSNNYHSTASKIHEDSNYKMRAIIRREKDNSFFVDTENLDDCWSEIDDEEEFKKTPQSFNFVGYESASRIVEFVTGKRENVLAEYKKIIKEAREAEKNSVDSSVNFDEGILEDEISEDEDKLVRSNYKGRDIMLRTTLPRKKGDTDDTYIFQKTF